MKESPEGTLEPMERLFVEVPEVHMSTVIDKVGRRKGEVMEMNPSSAGDMMKLEFRIPARGLIGYRSEFLTDTKGYGVFHHLLDGYEMHKGVIRSRSRGSLVAHETGTAVAYGIYGAQERGKIFVEPGMAVYEGMIVGESSRLEDIAVNVCRKKQMTNIRASGADDSLRLTPATIFSLEQALEFIMDDELVEITPKNIRLRKKTLNKVQREREQRKSLG